MRVLHVYKSYYPEQFGGVANVIYHISEGVYEHGIYSRAFALSKEPNLVPFPVARHEAITVKEQISIASTGFSFQAFSHFRKQVAEADLIHYHFPWPFMDILHLACLVNKPSIATYHSDIVQQKHLLKLYTPLMHLFLKRMKRLVATSQNYVDTSPILARYKDKTDVVAIGIPDKEIEPSAASIRQWKDRVGESFYLFLGALRYYKAIPVLIEAARKTSLKIVIAGDGDDIEKLKKSAPDNVVFTGHYSDEDRAALLSLARCFMFPSHQRSEAFGISLLEGARAGLPLICCDIGTGTTYINQDGQTGLVVPPNDSDALAAAMLEIENDPEQAKKFGKAARMRFEELFTDEKMAAEYAKIYHAVMTENG